ncbi:MAG: Hsp20/alpha crystallin family protein [Pleurocapsa sp. MO_192.B19]|nr:Hsp20/alpha crystallin family protein [Pleurocapsa sp. MO_192.B19]
MKIVRLSPLEQMDSLRRQIDRVFDDIDNVAYDSYSTWTPAIELLDDSDNLILRMQLAGLDGNDIDIQVTRGSVTISGERHRSEAESWRYLHSEFNYGKFQRQISLPVPVVNSEATANYEAGILTLILPKAEEAKQRVVKISLGDEASANNSRPETESVAEEAAVNA